MMERFHSGFLPFAFLLTICPSASGQESAFSNRVAGLERQEGFIPFYWDAQKGQLLLEISRLGEQLLYFTSLTTGVGSIDAFLDRGQLGGSFLCRFDRTGPRVMLVALNPSFRASTENADLIRSVEESFPTSVLASFPVLAEEGDRVLVDATEYFLQDVADVQGELKRSDQGEFRRDPARSAVYLSRTRAFPRNTEVEAVLTFSSENAGPSLQEILPDPRALTLRQHHSFVALPPPGYRPRVYDPRVGFISTRFKDFAAPFNQPLEKFYVMRWRLEKKDPKARLSDPVEPITYYLDRGIPEPIRTAIREAALWWNHAFEEAGFRNAFRVLDLPERADFMDIRYSGIEWVNRAERGWSVGASQIDPRTGEILHGLARMDSHRMRTVSNIWRVMQSPTSSPAAGAFCLAGQEPFDPSLAQLDPGATEESLVLQRIAYLAAHEVGHTLGLNHNWAASTYGWGSVMDYLAPRVLLKGEEQIDLSDAYLKEVGTYDRFAIRWGYTPLPPESEEAGLRAIVDDGYRQGRLFPAATDPRWAEYDSGVDPVDWFRHTMKVRKILLSRFGPFLLKPFEPYYNLQVRFWMSYLFHRFGLQAALAYIGGQYQTNALKGDGQVPTRIVPSEKQREALSLVIEALEPASLAISDQLAEAMAPPPASFRRSREQFPSESGFAFDPLSAARVAASMVMESLLDRERAARLVSFAERQKDALTLDELFATLVTRTWGAPSDASSRDRALRRVAQRAVLDGLFALAAGEPSPEVRALTFSHLSQLHGKLRAFSPSDPLSAAHVRQAERDLARFLENPGAWKRPTRPLPVPPGRPVGAAVMSGRDEPGRRPTAWDFFTDLTGGSQSS